MKFLLDECITEPVAKALIAVECPALWSPDVSALGKGADDDAVYHYAATNGMALVTQDVDLAHDKTKQAVAMGSGCGVFLLRRPKIDSKRLKLIRLLTIWEELEAHAANTNRPTCSSVGPPA